MPEAIEDVVSDDAPQDLDVVEEIGEIDAAQKTTEVEVDTETVEAVVEVTDGVVSSRKESAFS